MTVEGAARLAGSARFDVLRHATVPRLTRLRLGGRSFEVYANANLSIYSGQACNARCPFCVEEVRPLVRGRALAEARCVEPDDGRYFAALAATLRLLAPIAPSVSVTGGEPSLDPRLPRILRTLAAAGARKRTLTTNGSGLLREMEGRPLLDHVIAAGVVHLNLSRALADDRANAALMGLCEGPSAAEMARIVARARAGGCRPRLSCVLARGGVERWEELLDHLRWVRSLGADNAVFRQLMRYDSVAVRPGPQVRWSEAHRVALLPLLARVSADTSFTFQRRVTGYYYDVEVWRWRDMDVVFEAADLALAERTRREQPDLVHELVFHPDGTLAPSWHAADGIPVVGKEVGINPEVTPPPPGA